MKSALPPANVFFPMGCKYSPPTCVFPSCVKVERCCLASPFPGECYSRVAASVCRSSGLLCLVRCPIRGPYPLLEPDQPGKDRWGIRFLRGNQN